VSRSTCCGSRPHRRRASRGLRRCLPRRWIAPILV